MVTNAARFIRSIGVTCSMFCLFLQDVDDFGYVTADYLDHLMYCANAPMSVTSGEPDSTMSCLASSGMPILPTVALGGFNGKLFDC